MTETFKAHFPWQSQDNIIVTCVILINMVKWLFFPQVEREKSKSLGKYNQKKAWEGCARAAPPCRGNGALTPFLQDCSSNYSMFYGLVNEIVWGSHGTDHIWFATFGTILTLFWKYLTNELGSQEWVLSFQDRKSAVLEFIELRKYWGCGNHIPFPWGTEVNATNLN